MPELELDMPKAAPKAAAPKKAVVEEPSLELAVDLRAGQRQSSQPAPVSARMAIVRPSSLRPGLAAVDEVAFDARLLADYGGTPERWHALPFYAWRVLRRQRELREVLVGRRAEAERTARESEDAFVAFAGRVRSELEADTEKGSEFAEALIELRKGEDVLRARDTVLAREQDAHSARLAAVAVRLGKLESELAQAQTAERRIAIELATAQAGLSREETKLKRVEAELRAAQRRDEPDDGGPPA